MVIVDTHSDIRRIKDTSVKFHLFFPAKKLLLEFTFCRQIAMLQNQR